MLRRGVPNATISSPSGADREEMAVEKIDLPFFFQLGGAIHPLTDQGYPSSTHINAYILASAARIRLASLWPKLRLTVCRAAGAELDTALAVVEGWAQDPSGASIPWTDAVSDMRVWQVRDVMARATAFETVLVAELQGLPTYHATRKGIYSMPDLIDNAAEVFPDGMRAKLSAETVEEIRQSGRCLAFDNATASGFHSMRAVESVMHLYYVEKCQPPSQDRLDSWGAYIAKLYATNDADVRRVVSLLQQLKDHDRNLIMHPEITLTPDDALTLFEIAQGAIMAMADGLATTESELQPVPLIAPELLGRASS